jgi:hypothetical protein
VAWAYRKRGREKILEHPLCPYEGQGVPKTARKSINLEFIEKGSEKNIASIPCVPMTSRGAFSGIEITLSLFHK